MRYPISRRLKGIRRKMRPSGGKKAIVRKALKKSWKRSVAKVAKKVINQMAENKVATYSFSAQPFCLQSTTTSLAGNYYVVSPSTTAYYTITQGTGNTNRVGNSISTKRLMVNLAICPRSYNATTNNTMIPSEVLVYFYKVKGYTNAFQSATDIQNFYENGSTTTGPLGYLMDINAKLNKDAYTYLTHKRYKVGRSVVGSTTNLTAANYNSATNNDFKWNVVDKISLTRFCPKTLTFSDNTVSPSQPYIHMLIQVIAADGTILALDQQPINVYGKVEYQFQDI